MLKTCQVHAAQLGGLNVNFQENDHPHIFGPDTTHLFRNWLDAHDTQLISNWNAKYLSYAGTHYVFNGNKITNFWLQYYPSAIDHSTRSYGNLAEIYKTEYEKSHHIPFFWKRYIEESGYKKWHVFNPLGIEVLNDKALLPHFDEIIRLYLEEEPIVKISTYRAFLNVNGEPDYQVIEKVFSERCKWVVKSRKDNREGLGVYVGAYMKGSTKKNGITWKDLHRIVTLCPRGYVFQQFLPEPKLELIDGDLPLNFHPAATGARLLFTPIGAG